MTIDLVTKPCDRCSRPRYQCGGYDECAEAALDHWRQRALTAEVALEGCGVLMQRHRKALKAIASHAYCNQERRTSDCAVESIHIAQCTLNDTAARPEVDATNEAARVDGSRLVGDVEPRSTTPTTAAERSLFSLRDRLRTLRAGCVANFGGGHQGSHREAFVHGMETVCSVVDAYLADSNADPNMTHSIGAAVLAAKEPTDAE